MVDGVEYAVGNANNDIDEPEKSTDSIPSPLFLGTKPKKRLTSKVWDDFIPSFVDGKLAHAECMHCHQIFNRCGTSSLWNHQAKCSSGIQIQKRQKLHEHTSLPSIQKSTSAANLDTKQKKLPILLSSLRKGSGTADAMAGQDLALLDTPTDTNRKNQEAIQNGSHEEPTPPEQKDLALPVISTDHKKKNQGTDQNISYEELVKKLAMDGHATSMLEQDSFWKLVAHLNPAVKIPSRIDLMRKTFNLFEQEKTKLKEKLAALPCRVCLSADTWLYDPRHLFLCLTVQYIDDEWKKQKKIIKFCDLRPSCSAEELSNTILRAIGEWGLDDKVFSIILDDTFIDDSVASNVKTSLQKRNKIAAKRTLLVARYATHLLDEIIQVGMDELDTIMENSTECSRMYPTPSSAHHPKYRYASVDAWTKAQKICKYLQDFHRYKVLVHKFPRPYNLFDKVWNVKEKVLRNCWEIDRVKTHREIYLREKQEEGISMMRLNMKKFNKCWKVCFLHFCMPMVMDPKYRLEHIKACIQPFTVESMYSVDSDIDDYICEVHDTLLNLYGEYSNQDQEPDCASWSKIEMGKLIGRDILHELYLHIEYPYRQRPLTELDHYLQEAQHPTGKFSVLQWWKENSLTYPSIGRMARDILALPCHTDCKVAIRIARLFLSEPVYGSGVEKVVCIQDWLAPAGTTRVESTVNLHN